MDSHGWDAHGADARRSNTSEGEVARMVPHGTIGDDRRFDALALAMVLGVGPRLRRRLLEVFGSATGVLDASRSELMAVEGIGRELAAELQAAREETRVTAEWAHCAESGIGVWVPEEFPPLLRTIADPPGVLFVRGTLTSADELSVAIVGTRHPTEYGRRQAARLAAAAVQSGLTVVSGFARGIDLAAHRAAWESDGRTIGVLASGVWQIYPPEHRRWVSTMVEHGALISEQPSQARPVAGSFPRRNRLIAGLSLGLIVVEAADRSGALISARLAGEQGREVFAVPGSVESRMARGCHQLLRDGARLVETIDDVLDELGPLLRTTVDRQGYSVRLPAELKLNEQQRGVLELIGAGVETVDELVRASELPVSRVLSTLSVLEVRGLVQRLSGQRFARRPG